MCYSLHQIPVAKMEMTLGNFFVLVAKRKTPKFKNTYVLHCFNL